MNKTECGCEIEMLIDEGAQRLQLIDNCDHALMGDRSKRVQVTH